MNVIDHPFRGQLMARILLAEDDEDMRRFLTRALENAGYQVVSFNNGRDAYDRLREEPFHLLLTDIVMPEMDGIELARKASELDPDLKIMFITGFAAVALNPGHAGAARRENPVEAVSPEGSCRRDRAADRRLSRQLRALARPPAQRLYPPGRL